MKNVILSSALLFLIFSCKIEIIDIESRDLSWKPPDYNYIVTVTTGKLFGSTIENVEDWSLLDTPDDITYRDDNPETPNFDNILSATFCRGYWVAVGETSRVTEFGSRAYDRISVYWLKRQSPFGKWKRYFINIPGVNTTDDRDAIAVEISCNVQNGEWYIAGWSYLLRNKVRDPSINSWDITHTREITPDDYNKDHEFDTLTVRWVWSFADTTYAALTHPVAYDGYLMKKSTNDAEWQYLNMQSANGLNSPPALITSGMFDPTSNSVVFGTNWDYVIFCKPSTLICRTLEANTGTDSMTTNYKGFFLGNGLTGRGISKRPEINRFVRPIRRTFIDWPIRDGTFSSTISPLAINYLKGVWFLGGPFGELHYNLRDRADGGWKRIKSTSFFGNRLIRKVILGGDL